MSETTSERFTPAKRFNKLTIDYDQLVAYYQKILDIRAWLVAETKYYVVEDSSILNGYYGHIPDNGGIVLTSYYGSPSKLWTPLGMISVTHGGSDPGDKWLRKAQEKLGLTVLQFEEHREQGTYGPVWALQRDLEGNELPAPIWQPKYPADTIGWANEPNADYDTVNEIWERLTPRLVFPEIKR